jgi:DNA-binding CsgD family transcriptional regulator/type II secretory pathway predicted ATPase ExeA
VGGELIAREHELVEIAVALHSGAGALVTGDAGVGKTALVSAAVERVASAGGHVARIVATSASRSMPFGGVAPLLPDDLTSLHPALVLGAVARRLREAAGNQVPVVVVDDAHLLDDHSAATVLGLVTSGAARALVTARTGEPAPDAVTVLWKDRLLHLVEIGPLDQAQTADFLTRRLEGDVSPATVELLWVQTRGNPLYLTEMVEYGRSAQRLANAGGVWLWRGDLDIPPRLADLVDGHFHGLTEPGQDAVAALVLGEPLPSDVVTAVAGPEALAELDRRDIVDIDTRHGRTMVRFAHPVLAAAAARTLGSSRRSRLAERLVGAFGPADTVRRASWQLDVDGPVDPGLLLAGARRMLLTKPALAARLAERAVASDPGPGAAIVLAGAQAELGDLDGARRAHALAAARVRHDADLVALRVDELALTAFSERRPDAALGRLLELRRELPERFGIELDSTHALLTMFVARPTEALALADRVLAADPPLASATRARTARIAGLSFTDRGDEAVAESEQLLALVAAEPVGPYAQGLAHAIAAMARLSNWDEDDATSTDPASGRWPVPPAAEADRRIDAVAWPLIEGARRLIEGQVGLAEVPLREAVVQQRAGEGLFRSEAVTLFAVCLAARGAVDEADVVLAESPPDRLAIYPGLGEWAAAAVDAARGRPSAVEHALAAASEAHEAGSVVSTVAYLAEAARMGAAPRAAELLGGLGRQPIAPVTSARAVGIRARASGDGLSLLDAAERHAALGMVGPALELAGLAVAALGRGPARRRDRAQALVTEMRRRLRVAPSAAEPVVPLTRRELEVARLAVSGMSDRDIATTLVVSVRTVESHLAACYRKLDISSRQALRDVLAGGA